MRLAVAFSLLASLGSVACAPALAADGRASLTVLSLNVLHGGPWSGFAGDGQQLERRMDLIAEELAALRPDVIALQEAAVSRRLGNVPERLARRLGLHHVYAPATTRVFGDGILSRLVIRALGFHEGPAVLSRFPIAEWDVSGLPRCEHVLDPRVLLRARLDTPWGAIDVFSTHTSRDDCQVRRITALVGQRRNGLPSVLMGDFNFGETSPAIRAMTEEAGFVDVYRHANPDALGPTARQRIDVPQPMARRRIDYIFLVPGLEVRGDVLRSRVVLDAPHRLPDGRTLWPSDHYGVIAELALSGAPGTETLRGVPRQASGHVIPTGTPIAPHSRALAKACPCAREGTTGKGETRGGRYEDVAERVGDRHRRGHAVERNGAGSDEPEVGL